MDNNRSEIPLGEYITGPDTIPLIMDGSVFAEGLRRELGIRAGSALAGGYSIDYIGLENLDGVIAAAGENSLSMIPTVMGLLDAQSLEASGILRARRQPGLDLRGRGTLIGFVDTGIDYTRDAFIYEDGSSKIKYIWDQTIKGASPEGFYYGAEYTGEQLKAALKSKNPPEVVPHRDTVGHGTFIASVAAGREKGQETGAAPDAEIIAVKLRQAPRFFYGRYLIPESQENAYLSSDLMLGIQYILQKAAELGRPAAICIAVGTNTSGHDGFAVTEEYLTRLSHIPGLAIACAAGNESQAGHHAAGRIGGGGGAETVELVAGGEDIFLTLWNGASDRMSVSIRSPAGELVPRFPVRSGAAYTAELVLERSRVSVEYYLPIRGSGDQITILKIMRPTPGIWRITVHGEIILDGSYHLWLPITGFIGKDTVFISPSPYNTVVTPATAVGVTACGAYDSGNNALYTASSWGPTRLPMMSPDLTAPGVSVGGVYPGGSGYMSGTSVSAAITAGACALMLQWGIVDGNEISLTSGRIRANLIRGCSRGGGLEYPNVQWGYGRLNLFESLNIIRPM